MKQLISILVIFVGTNILSYSFGSNTYEVYHEVTSDSTSKLLPTVYSYNTEEALRNERKLCNALFEMLHMYWQYYDKEYDEKGNVIASHNFFDDCIAETDAYQVADSIMEGNWEDFFYDWEDK